MPKRPTKKPEPKEPIELRELSNELLTILSDIHEIAKKLAILETRIAINGVQDATGWLDEGDIPF